MDNIFKHNSRSFHDVYNALVQAYPNKPTWLFKEMAGQFDFQSELMNRIATDILYPKTREAAYGFAARCDYSPIEHEPSDCTITVTLNSAMAKTIPVGHQFGGISSATGNMVIFEVTVAASSGGTDTVTCTVEQKKSYTGVQVATIDSQDDFMDYPIDGYINIIKDSVVLDINSQAWTRVDNFDNSSDSDRHFKLIYQSSGKVRIQFGNGVNGMKPVLNNIILADFSVTEGLKGKLNTGEISIDVEQDSDIKEVTNLVDCSGGGDAESVASIIRNARANARLREMVWSKGDIEVAAVSSSASVVKAWGIPGRGSASVIIIPSGGGLPSAGLKTTVQDYVIALTQFGKMPVNALDPTYVTPAITGTVTARAGYTLAIVEKLVEFALTLASSAYDIQVLEHYDDYGIESCRTNIINVLWSWAFTSNEDEALTSIVENWKDLLGTRDYREFGQNLELGDLYVMGNNLYDYGVDVFTLIAPTSNTPVEELEIIDTGTLTIN